MPNGFPWPRISIVTPSYNQGEFIEETIRSVLLQGYPNLEYIIIDGGSTDGSVEIIRKYEPWLAYWVSEKDNGQSHAINKGWQRATGSITAWLNSDDIYYPGALSAVAKQFASNPECGLIYASSRFIDENNHLIQAINTCHYSLEALVFSQVFLPQQSTFLSTEKLAQQGFLNESLHYAMDFDLWLRMITVHPYRWFSGIWSGFRLSGETKTVSQSFRFWPEIATILQSTHWEGRIPPELRVRAIREAQFTAGIELIRQGHFQDGVDFVDQALAAEGYPFGSLLNCVYTTITKLERSPNGAVAMPDITVALEKAASLTHCKKTAAYFLSAGMFRNYLQGDLQGTRRLGIRAIASSSDFRQTPKLMTTVGKSMFGVRLLEWARGMRNR